MPSSSGCRRISKSFPRAEESSVWSVRSSEYSPILIISGPACSQTHQLASEGRSEKAIIMPCINGRNPKEIWRQADGATATAAPLAINPSISNGNGRLWLTILALDPGCVEITLVIIPKTYIYLQCRSSKHRDGREYEPAELLLYN